MRTKGGRGRVPLLSEPCSRRRSPLRGLIILAQGVLVFAALVVLLILAGWLAG